MPVRSRGQLLAGIGALLGICTAGPGCQSTQIKPDTYALQSGQQSAPGPRFSFRQPPPETSSGQPSVSEEGNSAVAMQRPIAVRAVSDASPATVSMTWHTVQRAPTDNSSGAEPADGFLQQVSAQVSQPPAPLSVTKGTPLDLEPAPGANPTSADRAQTPAGTPADRAQTPAGTPAVQSKVSQVVHLGPPKPIHPIMPGVPVPKEFKKRSLSTYVIEPPDILLIQATPAVALRTQPLAENHIVRPDGTIGLGIYGDVYVAGMTLEQAKVAIATQLKSRAAKDLTIEQIMLELQVDVVAYNSKFYYIIADGGGYGQQVFRLPITGNETVLDAISQIGGLPAVAWKKKIWVARAVPEEECPHPKILPVDWAGITKFGCSATNYQMFPGDRLYVQSDPLIRTDSFLAKCLTPLNRFMGSVLLSAGAINSAINVHGPVTTTH